MKLSPLFLCFLGLFFACQHPVVAKSIAQSPATPSALPLTNAIADDPDQDIVADDDPTEDTGNPDDGALDPPKPSSPIALKNVAACERAFDDFRQSEVVALNAEIDALTKQFETECATCKGCDGFGFGCGVGQGYGSGGGRIGSAELYSTTNNQVESVDEGDIVKTDGKHMFVVTNGALRIVRAFPPDKARVVSVTPIEGNPVELLITKTRAIVFVAKGRPRGFKCTYAYDCEVAGDGTSTAIEVFDTHDRSHPKKMRQIDLSGSLLATRRIGHMVYAVTADGYNLSRSWTTDLGGGLCKAGKVAPETRHEIEDLRKQGLNAINHQNWLSDTPSIADSADTSKPADCAHVYRSPTKEHSQFTSVVSLDVRDPARKVGMKSILAGPGVVYVSHNALYLASIHKRADLSSWFASHVTTSESEVTSLHKFTLGNKQSGPSYVASGLVSGHVLNQFSMDEDNGNLRLASSNGQVPDPNVSSTLAILQQKKGQLEIVGRITGIAPKEDIRSVRFDGDRGYVVTFKKTDPLFVFDLSEPTAPKLLGELKIPGFSTYIHRIDQDHLLTIGFDANDHDSFAYFGGLLLQIFDVADPKSPKLLHKKVLGSRGSSSLAAVDHLAFNYFGPKNLLALPLSICSGGGDGVFGNKLDFSGLAVFRVDRAEGFQLLGGITANDEKATCDTWWSHANSVVKRSVFMDNYVYAITHNRLKIADINQLGTNLADIRLSDLAQ